MLLFVCYAIFLRAHTTLCIPVKSPGAELQRPISEKNNQKLDCFLLLCVTHNSFPVWPSKQGVSQGGDAVKTRAGLELRP